MAGISSKRSHARHSEDSAGGTADPRSSLGRKASQVPQEGGTGPQLQGGGHTIPSDQCPNVSTPQTSEKGERLQFKQPKCKEERYSPSLTREANYRLTDLQIFKQRDPSGGRVRAAVPGALPPWGRGWRARRPPETAGPRPSSRGLGLQPGRGLLNRLW